MPLALILPRGDHVCVLSSHLFWTSGLWTYQPRSHRISHPPSFCGAYLKFSRERKIHPFVFLLAATVESNHVYQRINRSPLLGHLYKKCFFFPTPGFELMSQLQKFSRIPTERPGRPACVIKTFRWGLLVHATKLCPFARAYGKYGNRNYAH